MLKFNLEEITGYQINKIYFDRDKSLKENLEYFLLQEAQAIHNEMSSIENTLESDIDVDVDIVFLKGQESMLTKIMKYLQENLQE